MMARYWKIRKGQKWLASIAGGVPARRDNSLPSWEGDRAADENPSVTTTVPQRQMKAHPGGTPVGTEHKANMGPKMALTGKVIGRYKTENQWLVLNP